MQLKTKHFGDIQIDESKIISFSEGLPGFINEKRFIIIENDDKSSPFQWLQSIEKSDLAFVIVDPFKIKNDYDIEIDDRKLAAINVQKPEEVAVYCIVVVPEDLTKISMNLKAPVIINTGNNKGIQVVLDTDKYSVRHYIMDELRRQEVEQDAGSDEKKRAIDNNK